MDDDSSIDGDLEEFLRQNGIDSLKIPPTLSSSFSKGGDNTGMMMKSFGGTEVFGDESSDISPYDNMEQYNHELIEATDAINLSLPAVYKVSQLLSDNGFDVVAMTPGDIDSSKKVSVYVMDQWAASILSCMEEMSVRLETHHTAVKNASLVNRKVEVSHEALETRVRVLQDKLLEAERKVKASDAKVLRMEEDMTRSSKSKKSDDGEARKAMKGLEEKIEVRPFFFRPFFGITFII